MSFNFESFIASAQPATRKVTIYPLDLSAQIEELNSQAETAKGAEKKRLITERDKLREQMDASAVPVMVRPLTSAQLLELQGEDGIDTDAKQIAFTCVEPTFTPEQARQMMETLPASETRKIIGQGTEMTFTEVKTPDFSHAG